MPKTAFTFLRFALSAAAGLALAAAPAAAQAPRAVPIPAPAPTVAKAPAGHRDAIRVHGRWTIVVRNKDGSVAARRQFENNLMAFGANLIPRLLAGTSTPGAWGIYLAEDTGVAQPCPGGNGISPETTGGSENPPQGSCVILQATGIYNNLILSSSYTGCPFTGCGATLKVSVVKANTGGFELDALQLSGSVAVTTPSSGYITTVGTILGFCSESSSASAIDPNTCATNGSNALAPVQGGFSETALSEDGDAITAFDLPSSVEVVSGQTVEVTVLISFS